ncbi:alpha/beta fold hydrolase [Glaciihabitans arcticus]|uniref:Alpha/beta fold hydrolase n=1 Tax=Glaciihabitans arcticus TaxID=2668039 RepID=A0A4Q9GTM0_9MICO|nr:alpha/beta fold hydrolase [Glaciihabitans arcticus]TBN58071.1 alpha/beta fold hydrolase [Glaciihabitans arcticus]
MPYLELSGARLYYETAGTPGSPALLLIHAGIANLRMWDPQVEALAAGHHVIRFDTRGYGLTESQDVLFSNRADAIALLDELGVSRATLIGCSRGGSIAIDTALEFPTRVAGLVTIGSGPSGHPAVDLTDREEELFTALDEVEESGDWEKLLRLEAELWDFGPLREAEDLAPTFVLKAYELNLANLPRTGEAPMPIPLDPPAYGRVDAIAVPTLVIVGDHDITPAIVQYEYLLSSIPDAAGIRYPDAAHIPSVEHPERVEWDLLHWLELHNL